MEQENKANHRAAGLLATAIFKHLLFVGVTAAPILAYADSIMLSWSAVQYADKYRLERANGSLDGGLSFDEFVYVSANPSDSTVEHTDDGVVSNNTYTYRVIACLDEPQSGAILCDGIAEYSESLEVEAFTGNAVKLAFTYDELGRLTLAKDPTNGDRDYEYDDAGNRKSVSIVD